MTGQAVLEIGTMTTLIIVAVDFAKTVLPDDIEKIWIPIIAMGAGVGLSFLANISIAEGINCGLAAIGLATGRKMVGDAVVNARENGKKADKGDSGKPEGDF